MWKPFTTEDATYQYYDHHTVLPITLSSALEYTSPCLFPATHWYIPVSDRVSRLMDSAPLTTCMRSYGHRHMPLIGFILLGLICIKTGRRRSSESRRSSDRRGHKSGFSSLMEERLGWMEAGLQKMTLINLHVYERNIKPRSISVCGWSTRLFPLQRGGQGKLLTTKVECTVKIAFLTGVPYTY